MSGDQDIAGFIRASFRSIWSLETLILLRKESSRWWVKSEIVSALRASDLVVSQSLEGLCIAGLVIVGETDRARYQPVNEALERSVQATLDLYARSPDAVRRMIVTSSSPGLAAFAQSFRLKKDR